MDNIAHSGFWCILGTIYLKMLYFYNSYSNCFRPFEVAKGKQKYSLILNETKPA